MKKTAIAIYHFLKSKGFIRTEEVRKYLVQLHRETTGQIEMRVENFFVETIHKVLLVLIVVGVLLIAMWAQSAFERDDGVRIVRSDYGEEEAIQPLLYRDSFHEWQELEITVPAVQYRPEELKSQFEQGFSYLEGVMLGENTDLENIHLDMELPTSIPDSGLIATWSSEDYELLNDKGVVNNYALTAPQSLRLQLQLSYEDITETREYELTIQPKRWSEQELEAMELQAHIQETLGKEPYEKEVHLPGEMNGLMLSDTRETNTRIMVLLLLGGAVCLLLWFRQMETLQGRVKRKKQELLREYPGILNQLLLYLEAGTTIKGAFERLLHHYEKAGKEKESTYQELKYLWNELQSGVPQERAYLNWGKRIGILPYMKLSSLLTQQVRKGTGEITDQLEQEEHAAFERRKELAKKSGEEAGTKLLFPMLLLMLVSMVLVVCPALMNFMI